MPVFVYLLKNILLVVFNLPKMPPPSELLSNIPKPPEPETYF